MTQLFANNATTTLAANLASGSTSVSVASSSGFPAPSSPDYFYSTLIRASDNAIEIVKITAVSGTTWTIVRAQDGTTALNFVTGDKIELRMTNVQLLELPGRLTATQKLVPATSAGSLSGTIALNAHTNWCIVWAQASGGGSGALVATSAGQYSLGMGGGAGGFAKFLVPASLLSGASYSIGAGGTAGTAGGAGGDGGTLTITNTGLNISINGGTGGSSSAASSTVPFMGLGSSGGNVGSLTGATTVFSASFGGNSTPGIIMATSTGSVLGSGSLGGIGGMSPGTPLIGTAFGSGHGGNGGYSGPSAAASNGIAGYSGSIIIEEYA